MSMDSETNMDEMDGVQTAENASGEKSNIVTICATVNSGFEYVAMQECTEKIGADTGPRAVKTFRGRFLFDLPYTDVEKATKLRSVDNLSVLVGYIRDIDLAQEKEIAVRDLIQRIDESNWKLALDTWREFTKTDFCLDPLSKPSPDSTGSGEGCDAADKPLTKVKRPTFRVTCTRTGDKHVFNSRDIAPVVGDLVNERFGWPVRMKEYDIEVVVNVLEDSVLVALSLTSESLHRRNIKHFGITTLKSTIAYCMLRLAQPQAGEVICDPLCGVGAIPLEGLIDWKSCYVLAGDLHDVAVERTKLNYDAFTERRKNKNMKSPDIENDVCQWDVTNLPLRSSTMDIFVSDLPFGKRMGSKRNNWSLYLKCLEEMARVCPAGTGRAVLLTQDKKCMVQTLQRCHHLWRKKNTIFINHGGLRACVYLLQRAKVKGQKGRVGDGGADGASGSQSEPMEQEGDEEEMKEIEDRIGQGSLT